jgi:hypothetical protein
MYLAGDYRYAHLEYGLATKLLQQQKSRYLCGAAL